jgi:hypothetical protein
VQERLWVVERASQSIPGHADRIAGVMAERKAMQYPGASKPAQNPAPKLAVPPAQRKRSVRDACR